MDNESRAVMRLSDTADAKAVPADVLARTLSALQQLVYIVASDEEHRTIEHRFRVTSDIEQDYKLLCSVPESGSYAVPLSLAPITRQLQIGEEASLGIFARMYELLDALAAGDMQRVERTFNDSSFVKRSLQEVRKLLPKSDDSWMFSFQSGSKSEVRLRKELIRRIDQFLTKRAAIPEESILTITGELVKIDFDERKVFLRYPPTSQEIECIYEDELEDEMLKNRRQFVQVTGKFTLNDKGYPAKLTECSLIEPLDLTPIILSEVTSGANRFRFKTKQTFHLKHEQDEKQLLLVDFPQLEIFVYARTREDLIDEIGAYVGHLWSEYANCPDEGLTPEAVSLKKRVLDTMELINVS